MLIIDKREAFIVKINKGKPVYQRYGKIKGVEIVTPKKGEPRTCFVVEWNDKVKGWIPIDSEYKIVDRKELKQ